MRAITGSLRRLLAARVFVTDWSVTVLAAAVVAGALRPVALPVVATGALVVGAGAARRPWLVVLTAPLLAGALAHQAIEGATPAPRGRMTATATLVTDPDEDVGSTRALVRADGHRYELQARGGAAGSLRRALAGESVAVSGRVEPRRPGDDWLLTRHVIGRVVADEVRPVHRGGPAARAANAYRRLLERGAESLDPATRALFTGFVLGDDRFQDPATIDAFRATGLSHLLVVSGQNVAFFLVVLRPVLARVGLRTRFVLAVTALVLFALLTRLEPSVLRATAMATVATLGTTLGRKISPLRGLSLAVAGLVLVDPLLVRAFGFQLSVAASAGIIVGAGPLAARLPGPRPPAELLAVTLAAQLFVAPLLMATPEGIPLATLPANLLAVPAAAPVMVWGLTGGVVAGVAGGVVATAVHLPTRALLWWVRVVGEVCAGLPLGRLGPVHVLALAAVAGLFLLARVAGVRGRPRIGAAVLLSAAVLVAAALGVPRPAPRPVVSLGVGADLWRSGDRAAVLVVDGRADPGLVLRGLRVAGVRSLAVVVCRTASRASARLVTLLGDRLGPAPVVAPAGSPIAGAHTPDGPIVSVWDGLELTVTPSGERLDVHARIIAEAGVGSPGDAAVPDRSRSPPPRAGDGRPDRALAGRAPLRHRPPRRGHGHPQPHARLVLRPGWVLGLRRVLAQG